MQANKCAINISYIIPVLLCALGKLCPLDAQLTLADIHALLHVVTHLGTLLGVPRPKRLFGFITEVF